MIVVAAFWPGEVTGLVGCWIGAVFTRRGKVTATKFSRAKLGRARKGPIVQITTNQLSMSACFAQNGKPYANLSQVAKAMAGSGGNKGDRLPLRGL
jgi:hypothetical protein